MGQAADTVRPGRFGGAGPTAVWSAFVVVALLLLDVVGGRAYAIAIAVGAAGLALGSSSVLPSLRTALVRVLRPDGRDLVAIATLEVAVVGLMWLGFGAFTTDRVAGFFLSFALALVLGVAGPIAYVVRVRGGTLRDLGIGRHRWRATLVLAVVFGGVQFAITLWGIELPRPVDWIPLLGMALTVGVFESIFFRGFIQGRLQASFGRAPAVLGAAGLYAIYHVGYGMGANEMVFLFGLGVVYGVAFAITENLLVLWPLLTPLGSFFAQLEEGELAGRLPWISLAGFADVLGLMTLALWLAHRIERQRRSAGTPTLPWPSRRAPRPAGH